MTIQGSQILTSSDNDMYSLVEHHPFNLAYSTAGTESCFKAALHRHRRVEFDAAFTFTRNPIVIVHGQQMKQRTCRHYETVSVDV